MRRPTFCVCTQNCFFDEQLNTLAFSLDIFILQRRIADCFFIFLYGVLTSWVVSNFFFCLLFCFSSNLLLDGIRQAEVRKVKHLTHEHNFVIEGPEDLLSTKLILLFVSSDDL